MTLRVKTIDSACEFRAATCHALYLYLYLRGLEFVSLSHMTSSATATEAPSIHGLLWLPELVWNVSRQTSNRSYS